MPLSQTWPALPLARGSAETGPVKEPLKIETTKIEDDLAPNEICLSPSWSDHGEKKRRKEKKQRDKEQKELDKKAKEHGGMKRDLSKKARKEEERESKRAADVKAGKRLSKKPPPAAMETQKMPTSLRRNSLMSIFSSRPSSREGSRRNSLSGDERRLSGISLSSFTTGRSHSTPATSDEPADSIEKFRSTISATAPQLPCFSWKSQTGLNQTSRGVSWVSEDAYDKEVIEFAYKLDASAFVAGSEKIEKKRSQSQQQPRKSHFKEHTEANGFSRSATEPILMSSQQVLTVPKAPPRSPKRSESHQQDSSEQKIPKRKEVETAIWNLSSRVSHPVKQNGRTGGELPIRAANERQAKGPEVLAPQKRPAMQLRQSHDGSSYVQKQRMYQQQMSIAGFQDQEAVQRANELAAENENAVGAQSHAINTPNESQSSAPIEKATIPRAHQDHRQDVQEMVVPPASDGQPRGASSPQSRLPATRQPQKPMPLSQSAKPVDVLDKPSPNSGGANPMQAQDSVALNKTQLPAGSKSDKVLGFRKRSKPPPSKIWVSEDERISKGHQYPMSAPPAQLMESASKHSKTEEMFIDPLSAQIPFRKRADSTGSANFTPPYKDLFRTHTRNRTNSSEALTADLPSPVPWSNPMDVTKPKTSKPREQPSPSTEKLKPPEKDKRDDDARLDKSHSQSSSNTSEKTLKTGGKHPDVTSNDPKDANKQLPQVKKEQKATDAQELTRYELVETIKPRSVSSKATSSVEAEPPIVSSPSPMASMAANSNITTPAKPAKAELEVVLESMSSEGLIRKTSITRPRSNPQLQTQTTATNSLPSLDFLPQLKHQPLVKRNSPPRTSIDSTIPQFPPHPPGSLGSLPTSPANSRNLASTAVDLPLILPRSPLRPPAPFAAPNSPRKHSAPVAAPAFNRSSTSIPSASTTSLSKDTDMAGVAAKPIAKLFVICCKCKFWHDLPSKLYEAMALPKELHHIREEKNGKQDGKEKGKDGMCGEAKNMEERGEKVAQLDTAVKCPWCEHAMTTWCCQGWTTVVYLHQRHH